MAAKSDFVLCETCTHTVNIHDEDGVCHAYQCECNDLKIKNGLPRPSDVPVYNSGTSRRRR